MLARLALLMLALRLAAAEAPPAPDPFLVASRAEHDRKVTWQVVREYDFTAPDALAGTRAIAGQWAIVNGALEAVSGEPERNRTLLLCPMQWDYLKVEVEFVLTPGPAGRIGDFCLRFAEPEKGSFAKHYAVITGQYYNQASVVYRRNIPIARTEWSPLVAGRTHRAVLEYTGDHLRYWIDDRVVLEAWDRQEPVPVKDVTWLGVSTYDSHLRITRLRLSAATPPPKR
jgi:hypothetical protein